MPPVTLPEIKNISVALALAITIFTLGWSTKDWSEGIARVEKEQTLIRAEQIAAERERKVMWDKLTMLDRFGDALIRIEQDIKELKQRQ